MTGINTFWKLIPTAFLPTAVLVLLAGSALGESGPGAADDVALAPSEAARGRAIAVTMDQQDRGFVDSTASLRMELYNQQGQVARRALRLFTLEVEAADAGDRSVAIFDEPRDVAGTALLTYAKVLEANDQWIFLPALERVKRIASTNQSGSFMGSEFAYEDMSPPHVDRFAYSYVRDEACSELECFVIERLPLYENSGYSKQVVWIDQAEFRLQRVDYYDRKEELLKTLRLGDYRFHLERYWRAHDLEMSNHQSGKSTRLVFDDYSFHNQLSQREFTPEALRRVR